MRCAKCDPATVRITYEGSPLPLEKDPVGLAITCVYPKVGPFELVEVLTIVIRGGVVVTLLPSDELVSMTDMGVEKVENG